LGVDQNRDALTEYGTTMLVSVLFDGFAYLSNGSTGSLESQSPRMWRRINLNTAVSFTTTQIGKPHARDDDEFFPRWPAWLITTLRPRPLVRESRRIRSRGTSRRPSVILGI
jgi:hypothetical protein